MNNNYKKILKWLVYMLVYMAFAVLQTNVLPYITLFGVHPNVLPLAAAMVSVLEGGVPGALFGVFAGLCCDALYPKFEVVHTIYFFASGLAIGNLVSALFKKSLYTAALCAVVSLAVLDFILVTLFFLIPRRAGLDALIQVALPEIILSALFTPLVYWPLRGINVKWEKGEG